MMNHQINVSVFWNLTQFLSQETNFVVWYPMIKVFEYMSITIPLSKEEIKFTDIMEKFRKLLEKPLKTLGYEEQLMENDFTKCLRQEIVKWACTLQYDECERSALRKLEHHLENHESRPLLSWWKHWTYCNGLRIANSSVWSHVTDFLLRKHDRKLLSFLPCSEYGAFTSLSFFELFTEDERHDITIIRLQIDVFHSIIMKHSNTYSKRYSDF
ncbi:PREDICTED: uncharacterized protein LOC105153184 [Acromyrmex echinatior]|uniref:uncharacterized protein LOC105153184 n=1 Tax=Acromyrmex echinatior TaxID=103372 RepID=UPI000580DD89|nr:PREDICTED: uncharacterized protein LOC105153184 [Acromyrmex echinatior]